MNKHTIPPRGKKVISHKIAKCYKELVLNSRALVKGIVFNQTIVMSSGRAAGKSHIVIEETIKLLGQFPKDDAIIVVYNVRHKVNTARLVRTKLKTFNIKFKEKTGEDGEKNFLFGNNNCITIMSLKATSKEEEREKMKTSLNYNYENGGRLRTLILEEWTAIIDIYDDYLEANNAISSFGRLRPSDGRYNTYYIYNPPNNIMHTVYDWEEFIQAQEPMNINATILDLPKYYQSKEDLKIIETWEKLGNKSAIDHYYMGKPNLRTGLAFTFNYDFVINELSSIFTEYQIFIDNGSKDATTFGLYGITPTKNVAKLGTYYHSGRATGEIRPYSDYALELQKFLEDIKSAGIVPSEIVTDSLNYTSECEKIGIKTQWIDKLATVNASFRELAFDFFDELVKQKRWFIYDIQENQINIEQLTNARVDNRKKFPRVAKVNNATTPEKKQIHTVDCDTYFAYYNSKKLLGREEVFLYAR